MYVQSERKGLYTGFPFRELTFFVFDVATGSTKAPSQHHKLDYSDPLNRSCGA